MEVTPLWTQKITLMTNIEYFIETGSSIGIKNNVLVVIDDGCRDTIGLNLLTGKQIWERDDMPSNAIVVDPIRDQIYITYGDRTKTILWALRPTTGQIIWSNPDFDKKFKLRVDAQTDGDLLIYSDELYLLDPGTGKPNMNLGKVNFLQDDSWRTWDLGGSLPASNIIETEEYYYLLTEKAEFLILNRESGKVVDKIVFSAPQKPGGIENSWISVQDDIVAIYFQDTNRLSVMRFGD